MNRKSELLNQHNREIQQNLALWEKKPLLREIYYDFYRLIKSYLSTGNSQGSCLTVEIGSGIGKIKDIIPECITTDIFANQWIDQVESAYDLSFNNEEVNNLILFDVFHHLRYPGTALLEFSRVLSSGGRVILFEPCISPFGRFVYGAMHPEPLGLENKIDLYSPKEWCAQDDDAYYAAQGNAMRLFVHGELAEQFPQQFKIKHIKRFAALSYLASGGYSNKQLYPTFALPLMRFFDRILPAFFDSRLLVVVEKSDCC